eukprot:2091934-Rhodomonas_salina.7
MSLTDKAHAATRCAVLTQHILLPALVAWKTSDVYRGGAWDDRDRPLLPGERLVLMPPRKQRSESKYKLPRSCCKMRSECTGIVV